MKGFTLSVLTMLQFVAIGQKKGDNAIIAEGNISMNKIKEVLYEKGYMINTSDTVFFSTEPKGFTKGSYLLKFNIHKTDTSVIIRGLVKSQFELTLSGVTMKSDYEQIDYRTRKGHPFTQSFIEMRSIAELLSKDITIIKL